MLNKKISQSNIINKFAKSPLSLFDYISFIVIAIFCFISFQQGDILHTGGSSFSLLNGHILDFYDYNKEYLGGNNYYLSTYILYAIWNIPIKLMGLYPLPTLKVSFITVMWYKALPVCLYLLTAYIIYRIALIIGMDGAKSRICAYAFLTSPIAFFSQFIFGQYDIFTMVFILLGIYFYLKKHTFKFILFFGIAITFKYFALLFFLPLLLLREKKYIKLFLYSLAVLIPIAAETLIYVGSSAFRTGVFGFGVWEYMTGAKLSIYSHANITLVIFIIVICYAWAYFTNPTDDYDAVKWMLFFTNIVVFVCFGLSMWHPQWLLLAVPFLLLSTFINKKMDVFLLLDIFCMLFFTVFTVNVWPNHIDQQLFNGGIWSSITRGKIGNLLSMSDIFLIKDTTLLYTLFSSILLLNVIFKHPKFCAEKANETIGKLLNYIRARFILGVSIFIIPAIICLVAIFVIPTQIFYVPLEGVTPIGPISVSQQMTQVFTTTDNKITSIDVLFGTFDRNNDSSLLFEFIDFDTKNVMFSSSINTNFLKDNAYYRIKTSDITVKNGHKYMVVLSSSDSPENGVAVYTGTQNNEPAIGYAMVNDEIIDGNLCITVWGISV